jgi:ribosomal-protein-alanine N-acetyltransferase
MQVLLKRYQPNTFGTMNSVSDTLLPVIFCCGLLRRLRTSDLSSFQAYRSIPELGRYQGWSPMSEAKTLAFLNEMNTAPLFTPGEWVQLGIAELGTEGLIGDIGLFLATDERTAEVGFTLEPTAQGRGIATAAVRAAVQLLFAAKEVQQVLGVTDSRNAASVRLLKRAGFHHKESRHAVFRGEPCSEEVYVLPRNKH